VRRIPLASRILRSLGSKSNNRKEGTQITSSLSQFYRAMIYFAVSGLHFYVGEIKPAPTIQQFRNNNPVLLKRIHTEAIDYLQYKLSNE